MSGVIQKPQGGLSSQEYERARRLLMRRDPVLRVAIRQIGRCGMAERQRADHMSALIGAIVGQQLSTKAAATIYARFLALFPGSTVPDPGAIAALDDVTLRSVGLSGQKISYLRDLSARILDGRLRLDELDDLSDELVIERLTAVRGFGRWSAEMFLMFRLHRPDVLPVGDLGIVTAVKRLYGLRKPPTAKRLIALGEEWRPYRSVACWYLWQSLRLETSATKGSTRPRSR